MTMSSRELAPSLLAPCTEAQPTSPAANRPGTTRSWSMISPLTGSFTCGCVGVVEGHDGVGHSLLRGRERRAGSVMMRRQVKQKKKRQDRNDRTPKEDRQDRN